MMRFFAPDSLRTFKFVKYIAFNGVLVASHYDAQAFHAHLLIDLHNHEKIKHLSFSYFKEEDSIIEEAAFTMSFSELQVSLTFNSNLLYNVVTVELNKEVLENLQQSILNLYLHPLCNNDDRELLIKPNNLLKNLFACVVVHSAIFNTSSNEDKIHQAIPMFIKLLTTKFNEERERLDLTVMPVQSNSMV